LAELLVWPVLAAYGEAVVAYAGAARHPGRAGQLATWGVRLGWLAQTALLAAQAVASEGFPWTSWAGTLNVFVWLVVGVYLFWGCRSRFRLLGLAVMPLAVVLFLVAFAAGGTAEARATAYPATFLVLHVGLILVGFAGLTLAAAVAALYLWQERRIKRRTAAILRLPAPSLVTLDRLAARAVVASLPLLTLGIAAGLVRLVGEGGGVDALMAVTLAGWAVYAAFLALRYGAGWRGRKAAWVAVGGVAFVLAINFGLPLTHF
jgi:ABC-type uncharacterized transport system permease subunit